MSWIQVVEAKRIPHGRGLRVDIGDRCSHAEASLAEGDVFGLEVECPRHGSAFDLRTGEPHALPATQPVPVYDVKVEDGMVFLRIGED